MNPPPKAIALMSGGLDSMLAAKLVKDQGVEVMALHLASPFSCRTDVEACTKAIGIPLFVREKGEEYLKLLENPKFGYGRAINPCLDCRVFMFDMALAFLEEQQADFVVTGEVVGQRPMSQRRDAMDVIDQESQSRGKILRPLSAKLLPPTEAEEKGWVQREKLLALEGRGRSIQLKMAEDFGFTEFGAPGGGCLLTEVQFAPKLRDLLEHEDPKFRMARSELLRHGRHFRLSPEIKLVVGRDGEESEMFRSKWTSVEGMLLDPVGFKGPSAIAFGELQEEHFDTAGSIILRYSKFDQSKPTKISYRSAQKVGEFQVSAPITPDRLEALRI